MNNDLTLNKCNCVFKDILELQIAWNVSRGHKILYYKSVIIS